MEYPIIGCGDVTRGNTVVLSGAIYKLALGDDGRVTGSVKAPSHERLCHLARPGPRLQLRLEDGSLVSFFVYRAQTAPGGWADVDGRLVEA